jgi:hypothetical protein
VAGSDREWIVDDVGEDGRLSRDAVVQAFMEAEAIGHRIGYGITAVPIRVETDRGDALIGGGEPEVETLGWRFKLSRVPLAKRAEAPRAPEEPLAVYEPPEIPEEPEPEAETVGEDPLEMARNEG